MFEFRVEKVNNENKFMMLDSRKVKEFTLNLAPKRVDLFPNINTTTPSHVRIL